MSNLPGQIRDSNGADLLSDPNSGAFMTVPYDHAEIHKGKHYFFSECFDIASATAVKYWNITTPNTTAAAHVTFGIETVGRTQIFLTEDPTLTSAGSNTTVLVLNSNRNSANVGGTLVYKDPVVSSTGTTIFCIGQGVSGANPSVGHAQGISERGNEFVLKTNEQYLVGVKAMANSITGSLFFNWYEHSPRA